MDLTRNLLYVKVTCGSAIHQSIRCSTRLSGDSDAQGDSNPARITADPDTHEDFQPTNKSSGISLQDIVRRVLLPSLKVLKPCRKLNRDATSKFGSFSLNFFTSLHFGCLIMISIAYSFRMLRKIQSSFIWKVFRMLLDVDSVHWQSKLCSNTVSLYELTILPQLLSRHYSAN